MNSTAWQQWVRQPQALKLRKAFFQIHLWSGIALGIYVVVISISGSILVFRNELYEFFSAKPVIVAASGPRMSEDALRAKAVQTYPGYGVSQYFEKKNSPNEAVEIWLERRIGNGQVQRLFDPYTGQDLGNSVPAGIRMVSFMTELHVNLLYGDSGRNVNAAGAVLWTLLGISGCVVWWPGLLNWRRSLSLRRHVGWRRLNWDLHSAVGFWTSLFVLMWGITGIYAALPKPFRGIVDYFDPLPDDVFRMRFGDRLLRGVSRTHFGSFAGTPVKVLWCVLGLFPVLLFVTGAIMWWNRVVRKKI